MTWILISLAVTVGISVVALGFDFLAERWSKKEKTKKLVRRVLLLEASEKIADSVVQLDVRTLALQGAIITVAGLGLYFFFPLLGTILLPLLGTALFRLLPWVLLALVLVGIFGYAIKKSN